MYKYAKFIRRELLGVNGVKRVIIAGNREETINLTFSKETLARNGLIPTQVMMALQNAGKPIDAGSYQQEGDRIPLRIDGAISIRTREKDTPASIRSKGCFVRPLGLTE